MKTKRIRISKKAHKAILADINTMNELNVFLS